MPRSHRSWSDDSGDFGNNPITLTRTQYSRPQDNHRHRRDRSPEIVQIVENRSYLSPERGRGRAPSTGGNQPIINIVNDVERSPSRSRSRHRRTSSSESRERRYRRPSSTRNDLDFETREKLKKLSIYEQEKQQRETEERVKREIEAKRMQKQIEEQEQKEREKELRKRFLAEEKLREDEEKRKEKEAREKYIADYKREQAEKEDKKKQQKKEEDEKFERRLREEFLAAGYSLESIELMIAKRREKDRRSETTSMAIDLSRPTFIKVHRKYLHPDTLEFYNLPWHWDEDREYIIITRYISHKEQEELFAHSRTIFDRKLIAGPIVKETKIKVNDGGLLGGDPDGMYVVRRKSVSRSRKSPNRNSWLFT